MTSRSNGIMRASLAVAAIWASAACPDWKIDTPLETKITRIAAFRCLVPAQQTCQGRGVEIPAGQLPSTTEAFQVWAWHPGTNTTSWRLIWPTGYTDNQLHLATDSVGQSVSVGAALAAGEKQLWVRAAIIGLNGKDTVALARDSIGWTFP